MVNKIIFKEIGNFMYGTGLMYLGLGITVYGLFTKNNEYFVSGVALSTFGSANSTHFENASRLETKVEELERQVKDLQKENNQTSSKPGTDEPVD